MLKDRLVRAEKKHYLCGLSNNSNKCFLIALHWPSLNLKVTRKQNKSVNTCLTSESMLNIKITQFIRSNGADHLWHVIFITPVTRKEKTQFIGRGNQSNALNLSIWRHLKSFLPYAYFPFRSSDRRIENL